MSDGGNGKVLGAAIFGTGWVAGEHAKAYQKCERTKLVAVGSRKLESAKKCAEYARRRRRVCHDRLRRPARPPRRRPRLDHHAAGPPPGADHQGRQGRQARLHGEAHRAGLEELPGDMQKAVKQAGVKSVVSFCLHWNPSLVNTRA